MSSQSPSAFARPHILIVTDDDDLGAFLGEGLVYGGFWTSRVASGLQALELFRLRTFDLVLIDAALRGLGAIDLLRRLRAPRPDDVAAPRTDIPLLFVAATSEEMRAERAHDLGADGLITAPLDLEQLVPRLFQIVFNWRAAHPDRPWADAAAAMASTPSDGS